MLVGLVYNLITVFSIWNHHIYRENQGMMNFITLTDIILTAIMGVLNAWNWFLAMSGWSTIEMWGSNSRVIIFNLEHVFREEYRNMIIILEA